MSSRSGKLFKSIAGKKKKLYKNIVSEAFRHRFNFKRSLTNQKSAVDYAMRVHWSICYQYRRAAILYPNTAHPSYRWFYYHLIVGEYNSSQRITLCCIMIGLSVMIKKKGPRAPHCPRIQNDHTLLPSPNRRARFNTIRIAYYFLPFIFRLPIIKQRVEFRDCTGKLGPPRVRTKH